tara:strand:- start:82 stop:705 length:624 start_codon:yes stop_codon:yes gene_type:complete
MNYNLSDFIHVEYNTLSEEFCNSVIGKFETDNRKQQGTLGSGKNSTVNVDIKDSIDLMISGLDDWKEEDEILFNSVNKYSQKYRNKNLLEDIKIPILLDTMSDTGYQIQKTSPNCGYTWHDDFDPSYDNTSIAGIRVLSFIWYLNDISEGGYTEFIDGTKIQPERGKFLIFPSTWNFIHRGFPPKKESKYIITGWLHSDYSKKPQDA